MPNYRRSRTPGAKWFFTVVAFQRRPILTRPESRAALRTAIARTRETLPFVIDAWVLLPDHLHCIWQLPDGDAEYSKRWGMIKAAFSRDVRGAIGPHDAVSPSRRSRNERGIWQRRFWEHRIRDDEDLRRHVDYLHFNPVKHGHVRRVADWPWSSFHRYVADGRYPADWGGSADPRAAPQVGE
ncbi:MAG: transposase [Chromatiales bacterium]|nr:transposase [Chromatiales bacterium]